MSDATERPTPDLFEHVVGYRGFRIGANGLQSPYRQTVWAHMVDHEGWATAICGEGQGMAPMPNRIAHNTLERIAKQRDEIADLQKRLRKAYEVEAAAPSTPGYAYELTDPAKLSDDQLAQLRWAWDSIGSPRLGHRIVGDEPITAAALELSLRRAEKNLEELEELYSLQEHDAPGVACSCGLYAMHTWPQIPMMPSMSVIALVQAKGIIQVHRSGIRAEKMRVVAVAPKQHMNDDQILRAMNRFTAWSSNKWFSSSGGANQPSLATLTSHVGVIPNPPIVVRSPADLVDMAPEFGSAVPKSLYPEDGSLYDL